MLWSDLLPQAAGLAICKSSDLRAPTVTWCYRGRPNLARDGAFGAVKQQSRTLTLRAGPHFFFQRASLHRPAVAQGEGNAAESALPAVCLDGAEMSPIRLGPVCQAEFRNAARSPSAPTRVVDAASLPAPLAIA